MLGKNNIYVYINQQPYITCCYNMNYIQHILNLQTTKEPVHTPLYQKCHIIINSAVRRLALPLILPKFASYIRTPSQGFQHSM